MTDLFNKQKITVTKKTLPISSNLPPEERNDTSFEGPKRMLYHKEDLPKWLKSKAYYELYHFVEELSLLIKSKPLSYEVEITKTIQACLDVIQEMRDLVKEIPPVGDPMRYGNISFRVWFAKVIEKAEDWMTKIILTKFEKVEKKQLNELSSYFKESLGNNTRIDYGTGHETAFAAWMYCMCKFDIISKDEKLAMVTKIFWEYLEMIRMVQKVYKLEPAGSHGVWGLDDYQVSLNSLNFKVSSICIWSSSINWK